MVPYLAVFAVLSVTAAKEIHFLILSLMFDLVGLFFDLLIIINYYVHMV